MTESNWQGDMLRQMAEQSPAEDPARPDNPPAPAPAAPPVAPAGQGGPAVPPAPQQGPYQQQYGQQPPPPGPPTQYQQQPYPQEQYPLQPYPQQPPYPAEQYPPQQPPYPPEQYPPQPQYPQQPPYPPDQGYQQPPPYQPGPYEQQQYVPPPPYQPAPYEQYPPQQPYQQYPPYEQPQYEEQYPPQGQHHPGQVPHQDYYEQPPHQGPPAQDDGWGAPAPPTPQSDQIGTPMQGPGGDSVFDRFRRIASEAAYLVGASGRMQRDVDNIAMIRRPIAIMRRVGVLSPVTNGGTSTVTALLATMLAAQRSDRVVAVDADPGGAELSRRLEFSVGAGPIERVTLLRSEGTAEAVRTTLAEAQGQGARDVGLAVVDCPGGLFDEIPAELAGSGHCAVVVVPSVQHVANYCLAQLDQLTPGGQDVLLTRGIVVITMVENVDPASVTWLVEAFRQRGMEPVVLPFDLHIAQSWPLRTEQLQSDTRRAVLDLAARVVETVTRIAG
ncbi:MinD/ParA family protein [Kribbella sp. NPDC049174]|uniref:MinD/ParA family ATP-binding protein n=1 Tax=Kribbella sp. NPDC049174 TaxID=3364112 RepID=UPI003722F049